MRKNQVKFKAWPGLIVVLVIAAFTLGLSQDVLAGPLQAFSLNINPTSGLAGSTVTVSGSGWTSAPAAQPYEIHWNSKTGALLGNFAPNQSGNFSKQVTIPPNAPPGPHQVWACQACSNPNIVKWSSTTFTIIEPTPPPTREPTACDPSGAPGEIVVDFEDIPAGDEILDVLLPQGVTFVLEYPTVISFAEASSGTHVLANDYAPGNEFGSAGTPLVMDFQYIQDSIGMFIGTNLAEESEITATLTAYGEDEYGHLVEVASATATLTAEVNPLDTCLWLEAPGQIIRAALNYGPGGAIGAPELIDDLVLRGPETPVPVPEDDTPPEVIINDPLEGAVISDSFVRLEGDIFENRRIDRAEVWVNGELLKEIGVAWMGLEQYWFLDVVGREDLIGCAENTIEVVAYDDNGNEGRDQVVINYIGPGDLELTRIEPVQVMFGAPLVKNKSTAFRATLNSSFQCELEVNFRLELPVDDWSTAPPSTGWLFTDVPSSWSYPEIWGPVPIPPDAVDFEVMLPYFAPGSESQEFDSSSDPAGLIAGEFVGGISGPNIRVVPRPIAEQASFAVEIDPEDEVVEIYETNNRWEAVDLQVIETKPIRLSFIPWVFELYPTALETESDYEYYLREAGYTDIDDRLEDVMRAERMGAVPLSLAVSAADLDRLDREARRYVDFFLATFPFADSMVSYRLLDTLYFEEEYLKDHGHNTCFNGPFISDMHDAATLADPGVDVVILLRLFGCCGQSPGVYMDAGMELVGDPPHWIHNMINVDLDPGDEDYECWNWDFPLDGAAPYVISHELNHWLLGYYGECYACEDARHEGVDCAYCNTDADGFWVNAWMPIPEGTPYFSNAVCHECIYWNRLMPSLDKSGHENPDGYLHAIDVFRPIEDPDVLLVRGSITADDQVSLKPFLILADSNLDLRPEAVGDHSIVLYDSGGQILSRWGFTPSFLTFPPAPALPEAVSEVHFSYRVLWQEDVRRVEILNQDGQVLAARDVSSNAPQVRVIYPNGGESWREGKSYTVKWEVSDPDQESVSSTLLISQDGGESWNPLALDLDGVEFDLNTSGLASGENYLIKVIASDGINTGEDLSDSGFALQSGPEFQPLLPLYLAAAALAIAVAVLGTFYLIRRRRVKG